MWKAEIEWIMLSISQSNCSLLLSIDTTGQADTDKTLSKERNYISLLGGIILAVLYIYVQFFIFFCSFSYIVRAWSLIKMEMWIHGVRAFKAFKKLWRPGFVISIIF